MTETPHTRTQTTDPDTPRVLARYPLHALIQLLDGQHFMIVHKTEQSLVLQPVSTELAERLCGSDATSTPPSIVN